MQVQGAASLLDDPYMGASGASVLTAWASVAAMWRSGARRALKVCAHPATTTAQPGTMAAAQDLSVRVLFLSRFRCTPKPTYASVPFEQVFPGECHHGLKGCY